MMSSTMRQLVVAVAYCCIATFSLSTAVAAQSDACAKCDSEMASKLETIAKAEENQKESRPAEAAKKPTTDKSMRDVMPDAPEIFIDDPDVKRHYTEALSEYYKYRVSGYQHRQRVFAWQLSSSRLIFVTVLLLVFLGMYFAAVQFHAGLKFLRTGKPEKANLTTSLELAPDRGKVDSPVLGVIILLLSLGFFYLYLVFVYPIHDTF